MQEEIQLLKDRIEQLEAFIYKDKNTVEDIFRRNLALLDVDIKLSSATGTKIGTASSQKLAFYGSTPVSQQATISNPAGGAVIDAESRTAINSILTTLDTYGLTA